MREIKFRAWDNFNNRMIQNDRILKICFVRSNHIPCLVVYSNRNIENHTEIREDDKQYCNEFELMQYTGLKDKNGKEIYEGDIVEAWSEGEKAIGKVKQRIDGLWLMYPAWQSGKSWGLMPNKERKTTVKIIGNIYENENLIGDEE